MTDRPQMVEWNSNMAVLKRASDIIDAINESRFRLNRFDDYGNVLAEPEEVLSHVIALFKEIMVEMTPKDKEKTWESLKKFRNQLRIKPPKPTKEKMAYWKSCVDKIDDFDLEIRSFAKTHGFLAGNKKDVSKAILRRG